MAESKPPRSKARKATTAAKRKTTPSGREILLDETTQLSEEILQSVEEGQRAAIGAVQRFIDTVDDTLPALPHGDGPSRRQEVIDSALQMADRLVHTQYEFIRKIVEDTRRSLDGVRSK
jgi:hypothetical protein